MTYSRIAATGSYLPERTLTNADLEGMVETSDEWIRTRTGIEERHIVGDTQATSDLCIEAAKAAMADGGFAPTDIDLIVVGTTTPDLVFPNVATILQQKLGIPPCPAFSVEAACTGFLYALSTADKFVRADESRCALVIGAESLSRIVDWTDRNTCVLFGDGAGAVILTPSDDPGIYSTHLGADGQYGELLYASSGASRFKDDADRGKPVIRMTGNEVFKVAVKTLGSVAETALTANGLTHADIDWLVPHQANTRIIQATAKRLGLSMDKVILTVAQHGNTSAASVPLALDTAIRDGRIQRGHTLLFEAFGGGFTWGSALVRY
ncbi:MAG: beta-ketoacyl-ACP synthase III [Pseudomonadota bacterium]